MRETSKNLSLGASEGSEEATPKHEFPIFKPGGKGTAPGGKGTARERDRDVPRAVHEGSRCLA